MVFSSLTFLLLFLPILLLLYFMWNNIRWRNLLLVFASLLFYGWGEPVWIVAMLAVTAVNYGIALAVDRAKSTGLRRLCLTVGVLASLMALFYFKYAAFFVNSFSSLLGLSYTMAEQQLPIGISFYTFQVLIYTVDVYRKKADVQKNPVRLLLYVSCFPQLIAGPIVQYADVAGMLDARTTTPDDFSSGMKRFVVGLSKKILLANICGEALEQTVLAGAGVELSLAGAWFSAILYSMQLFFDFSAYSDMAIGLGRVLGFRYKENFNYPYISKSITEFWRRWHMSLSGFFRDYVYIPLGGNRRGVARTILNLAIVWSLTGLWHGASWNFVVWGLYYFVILVLERFVFAKTLERTPKAIRLIYSLIMIVIGWVIFYYTDFAAGQTHILAMFGLAYDAANGLHFVQLIDPTTVSVLKKYTVYPLICALCCMPVIPTLERWFARSPRLERAGSVLGAVTLTVLLLLSMLFLIGQSYNPFIYFRF